jgi:hypothetical protein
MVTPRTGRPRGRPPKDFLRDPERFAIPYALALMKVFNASENDAFTAAAAQLPPSTAVNTTETGLRRKRGRGALPPGLSVTYKRNLATFASKSSTLLKRARKAKAKHPAWCQAMSRAFELALRPEGDRQFSSLEIMRLTTAVDEGAYALAVLLPLLAAKFHQLPEYFPNLPDYFPNVPAK